MTATFRLPRKQFWTGVGYALGYGAATVGGVAFAFLAPDVRSPLAGACLFGGVFGTMTLLALYMIAAQRVERVEIDGESVTVRSMFQNRRFALSEIEGLEWKAPSAGRVTIDARGQLTRLDLNSYEPADRLRLMQLFHAAVPDEKQTGWPRFCRIFAMRAYDRLSRPSGEPPRAPEAHEMLVTRRHYDWAFAVLLPVSAIVAVIGWLMSGVPLFFIYPPLIVFTWLVLRRLAPRVGRVIRRPRVGPAIAMGLWSFVGVPLAVASLSFIEITENVRMAAALISLGPIFASAIYLFAHRNDDKERILRDDSLAVELWNRDERGVLKSLAAQ